MLRCVCAERSRDRGWGRRDKREANSIVVKGHGRVGCNTPPWIVAVSNFTVRSISVSRWRRTRHRNSVSTHHKRLSRPARSRPPTIGERTRTIKETFQGYDTISENMQLSPNEDNLQIAIHATNKVWKEWQVVFEYAGRLSKNPILADPCLFRKFCHDWSVARTIRAGTSDEFRRVLLESYDFSDALYDPTGKALDDLHESTLRPRFGTQDGKNGVQSVLSKIAGFVRPDIFTAWDRYATFGLNLAVGRSKILWYENYSEYLKSFNDIWEGPCGERIRGMRNLTAISVATEPRFQRRVLDLYLMAEGGFKHKT